MIIADDENNVPKLLRVDSSTRELQVSNESLAKGQTTIIKKDDVANGTRNIHTVTAGKIFYLCGCGVAYSASVSGRRGEVYVDSDAQVLVHVYSATTATYAEYDSGGLTMSYSTPLPLPAGSQLIVKSSFAGMNVKGWIIGWEEDE